MIDKAPRHVSNTNMDWVNKEFGTLLARARDQAGLNQSQLAEKMQLSRATIINMEKGRQNITLVTLFELASILQIDPSKLLPTEPAGLVTKTDEIPPNIEAWLEQQLKGEDNE